MEAAIPVKTKRSKLRRCRAKTVKEIRIGKVNKGESEDKDEKQHGCLL